MGRLRELVMFALIQEAGEDTCFRCGRAIESANALAIDHEIAWLDRGHISFGISQISLSRMRIAILGRGEPLLEYGSAEARFARSEPRPRLGAVVTRHSCPLRCFRADVARWNGFASDCKAWVRVRSSRRSTSKAARTIMVVEHVGCGAAAISLKSRTRDCRSARPLTARTASLNICRRAEAVRTRADVAHSLWLLMHR